MESNNRERIIVRTSVIGILANVLLAAFKAVIGILSHSIAISLDAVNNLSDALSSIITIIGAKLAGKEPDRDHPYGHGRAEYLSALVISVIILYAGVTSLIESVKKILSPQVPDYTLTGLFIIGVAVVVKILLGTYVKKTGEKVNSESLIDSGADALLDAVISTSTLIAAGIYIFAHVSLEAWLAAIISLVIIKAGVDMAKSTISQILGERVDSELTRAIRQTVTSFPEVMGAYDLVLNNYGPDTFLGSIHVEVSDEMSAHDIDELSRRINRAVFDEHGIIMVAVGVYSLNTKDEKTMQVRAGIRKIVMEHEGILQMHGFYFNEAEGEIAFDIIISFDVKNRQELYDHILEDVKKAYPDYRINIALDLDISD